MQKRTRPTEDENQMFLARGLLDVRLFGLCALNPDTFHVNRGFFPAYLRATTTHYIFA